MIDAHQAAQICGGERKQNKGWMCQCPAHDDRTASLKIDDRHGGGLLVKCFAHCPQDAVVSAMKEIGAWPTTNGKNSKKSPRKKKKTSRKKKKVKAEQRHIEAVYDYVDTSGVLLHQSVRFSPKSFLQRQPKPSGDGWIWNLNKVKTVPYQLPELLAGIKKGRCVFIVEGEKDCISMRDRLAGDGEPVIATCSPMGAGGWSESYNQYFTDAIVVIIPDNDEPGRKHAEEIFHQLRSLTSAIRILELPNLPKGGDVSDWIEAGGTRHHLKVLVQEIFKQSARTPSDPAPAPREPIQSTKPALGLVDKTGAVRAPDEMPEDKPELAQIPTRAKWEHMGLAMNASGSRPLANLSNALRIIEGHPDLQFYPENSDLPRGRIVYDEFYDRVRTNWGNRNGDDNQWTNWTDDYTRRVTLLIQREMEIHTITPTQVYDAIMLAAYNRKTNAPKTWMDSLAWDNERRLQDLMALGFGAKQNEYTEAVGRCWIMGMVRRILHPGCKVDNMPVFEGAQGSLKSSALEIIGGDWFVECHESVTSKDFYQIMQGAMLIEISELHAFKRSEVERIKGIITCRVDKYRKSYGRLAEDHPRMSVFSGTSNVDDWNHDETGARRFWPVTCGFVDLIWLRENRDQLFAEAIERVKAGEEHWNVPEVWAKREQESRRKTDEWEDVLDLYITNSPSQKDLSGEAVWFIRDEPLIELTIGEVLSEALMIPSGRWGRGEQMRISAALRAKGWHKTRKDGRRIYVAPEHRLHPTYIKNNS